jgi:hypothetical protein
MTDLYDQRRALLAKAVEALNQERFDQWIDAMKASERDNIWADSIWLARILDEPEANTDRLAAYKRKHGQP